MDLVETSGLSQNINFLIFCYICFINFKFDYHMKKEMNESYEDQVLKEFEETQEKEEPKTITDLGNINDNKRDDDR